MSVAFIQFKPQQVQREGLKVKGDFLQTILGPLLDSGWIFMDTPVAPFCSLYRNSPVPWWIATQTGRLFCPPLSGYVQGHVLVCVQMYVCTYLCGYVHVEVRGQSRLSSSSTIYLDFLRQGLLLAQNSPSCLGWTVSEPPGGLVNLRVHSLCLLRTGITSV